MSNLITSSREYTTFKDGMNVAISNFINQHQSSVKCVKKPNGKTNITLFYGRERDVDLKKIAETCMNTENDADFVIDGITMTIIHATDSVIVFEGETATIEAEIKADTNTYPVLTILTNQVIDFDVEDIADDVETDIVEALAKRSELTDTDRRNAGITVVENHVIAEEATKTLTKGKIIINNDMLTKFIDVLTKNEIEGKKTKLTKVKTAVDKIYCMQKYNKDLLISDFENALAEKSIWMERINTSGITFKYDVSKYSETQALKTDPTSFIETSDEDYVSGKTYYVAVSDTDPVEYRKAVESDFDKTPVMEEHEVQTYVVTEDTNINSEKTYYVAVPDTDPVEYRAAETSDFIENEGELTFTNGVTYYELVTTTEQRPSSTVFEYHFKEEVTYYEGQ